MKKKMREPRVLAERDVERLEVRAAGAVDLRRDLYRFVCYVEDKGLTRTKRGNRIPKTAARRLAKLLSWDDEAEAVEQEGAGVWSGYVSEMARQLGVVSFDTNGEYEGYSSTEACFPDNEIVVVDKAWRGYLQKSPLAKERALLDKLVETTPNEFFHGATLGDYDSFDRFGCATGPASRMDLKAIRLGLLDLLGTLEPDLWYDTRDLVELLRERAPTLILDPATREPDAESKRALRDWEWDRKRARKKNGRAKKPDVTLEDIYANFRESKSEQDRWRRNGRQITSDMPDAFGRVEGRYLEYFLREIPYLSGFVDLAYRAPSDRRGGKVFPGLGRLAAFRLAARFFQILRREPAFDSVKVTVLPTFEVLVEAPSFPECILERLEPFTTLEQEANPLYRLQLEKKKVIEVAAQDPGAPSVIDILRKLTGSRPPENVAAELAAWSSHGEKVILYEGFGLLELGKVGKDDHSRSEVLLELESLVEDDDIAGFVLVRQPDRALSTLEEKERVPLRVVHRAEGFASCPGRLGEGGRGRAPSRDAEPRSEDLAVQVRLESEDLIGYRASDAALLAALHEALRGVARTCVLDGDNLLVLSADALPRLRSALRRLSDRFVVTFAALQRPGEGAS